MKKVQEKNSDPADSGLFISRELSWIDFNARVLDEAGCAANPVLERLKFIAIFSSNLDALFMVNAAQLGAHIHTRPALGLINNYNAVGHKWPPLRQAFRAFSPL